MLENNLSHILGILGLVAGEEQSGHPLHLRDAISGYT